MTRQSIPPTRSDAVATRASSDDFAEWTDASSPADASTPAGDTPQSDPALRMDAVTPLSPEFSFEALPPWPHPLRHPLRAAAWILEFVFGLVSLFALLALLAAIPVANVLALGYMLDAEGRVARSGRLRSGMPLLPLAPKLGGIAFGTWIWCWVVQLAADAASDAQLIAPASPAANAWRIGVRILTVCVTVHIVLAIARGGRLRLFFWPTPLNGIWLYRELRRGGYTERAGQWVAAFVSSLRLRHHFWLGLRGFAGAMAWLFVPTVLFAALQDTSKPGQVLITILGGLALVCTLSWVPFLQARFAARQEWRSLFELRAIRAMYERAPIAFLLTTVVIYALALPLYLFKLFETPQDMRWLLTPIFVVTIYPARLLTGWAYSYAERKQRRGWLIVRVLCLALLLPLLGLYVFLLFFTPAVGAAGRAVLFQHHALLLPWPF